MLIDNLEDCEKSLFLPCYVVCMRDVDEGIGCGKEQKRNQQVKSPRNI